MSRRKKRIRRERPRSTATRVEPTPEAPRELPREIPAAAPRPRRRERAALLDVLSWPVVRAYIPDQNAWPVSGYGTAGVVREQPDGRWRSAFFWISLIDDGLCNVFGKEDMTPSDLDDLLAGLRDLMPRMEEGTVEQVAEYIWGAYALGLKHDAFWPPEVGGFLSLVPQPPGEERQWLDRLMGPGGLTPPGLVRVVRENRTDDELPEGKEIMVITTMTFAHQDAVSISAELRHHRPDFTLTHKEGNLQHFSCSQARPGSRRGLVRGLGGVRQPVGDVTLTSDTLVAEAMVLSMASVLACRLKEILGDRITLVETTWKGAREMFGRR